MAPPELLTDISWTATERKHRSAQWRIPMSDTDSLWTITTPLHKAGSRLELSMRRVQVLTRLSENWDSYGAHGIQPPAVEGAIQVLVIGDSYGLPSPHIAPVADGGLQVEWSDGARFAEVEVRPDGSVEYLIHVAENESAEGSVARDEAGRIVRAVLERLVRP